MTFTEAELAYLGSQPLGRLATVAPDGTVQNNPVSFRCDPETGTIDIGGFTLGTTKKFRNVERGSNRVSLVVDEARSLRDRQVRGVEIRGWAEALRGQRPFVEGLSPELIRIHPVTVFSWGVEPGGNEMRKRTVDAG